MPQSLSQVLIHAVFSTKNRQPFIADPGLRDETHRYLGGILQHQNCQPIIVGGVEDHVHLLFALSRTITVADLVKELKRSSSLWIKSLGSNQQEFAWQTGYGVFSIGYSQIEPVRKYIAEQEERHRKMTFQDEFRKLLVKYKIEFDERYVWD